MKEITEALTGDRRTEARGRAEEHAAEYAAPVTKGSVTEHLDDVRRQHGDVVPDDGRTQE